MKRTLHLGPLVVVHDEGIPLKIECPSEQDGLPPDVCEELLAGEALARRCAEQVEDEPAELWFADDDSVEAEDFEAEAP